MENTSYSEFQENLASICNADEWSDHLLGDLSLSVNEYNCFELKDDAIGIEVHPLAVQSILERAGVKGILARSALKEGTDDKELITKLVNLGFEHFAGQPCTLLVRDGYAMALHGSQYSVMKQNEGLAIVNDAILDRFSGAEFVSGSFNYETTHALYKVASPGDPIFSNYETAWKKAGLNTRQLCLSSGYIEVITSDVAGSSFKLIPCLGIKDRFMPLSSPLEVKHRGTNDVKLLRKCVDECFSLLDNSIGKEIPALMERTLVYPQQALVRILDKISATSGGCKNFCDELFSSFEARYDCLSTITDAHGNHIPSPYRDELTAFDLYCFLMEVQYSSYFLKLSEQTRIRIIEKLYLIPSLDWDKLDRDGSTRV